MSSTTASPPMHESHLRGLTRLHQGKVRDIYGLDDRHMLIVTTDRLSAFDVVLPDPIPGKGRVLTSISNFWFARTTHIVPNHLAGAAFPLERAVKDPADLPLIAEALSDSLARQLGEPPRSLSDDAFAYLARHAWPGNIRELANVLERALLMSDAERLGAADIEWPGFHRRQRDRAAEDRVQQA